MRGVWSVIIGGITFRQSAWPRTGFYWTGKVSGLGKGDIRTPSTVNSGTDGGFIGRQFLGLRQLPLELVVHSSDPAEVEARSKALEAALAINTDITVVFETPTGARYFLRGCRVVQCDPEIASQNMVDYTIQLLTGDPTFYDYTGGISNNVILSKKTPGGIAWSSNGMIWSSAGLPWIDGASNTIVNNLGDTAVYPVITISGGVATNPSLTNVRTGRVLSLNMTITASDVISIDFLNESVTLNGTNIENYLVSDDYWSILPGANEIEFATTGSTDTATASLGWNNGYAGII